MAGAPGRRLVGWLGGLSVLGLALHWVWVFGFTPEEASMGFVQKIMYVHVPAIYAAYVAFFVVFACSIGYLWKRSLLLDRVAQACGEIGLLFVGLGLFSGALWGRPTWGTYWVWDARLTSTLVLFLIYAGYVLLRALGGAEGRTRLLAAVIGVVGFLDLPLIHLSVRWWRTLHQPSTLFRSVGGSTKPALPPELLGPLLFGLASATLWGVFLLLLRLRAMHLHSIWEHTDEAA